MDNLWEMSEPDAHRALLESFAELALSRRYHEFGVGAIVEKARVARSTFYYHFKGKDDLLLRNLQPLIAVLARLPVSPGADEELLHWVSHLWEHRANGRRIFEGPAGRKIIQALAEQVQAVLIEATGERNASLLAHQIAAALFGLLQAWLGGRGSASPVEIAKMMEASAKALANTRP